jgi:hypothetical protein
MSAVLAALFPDPETAQRVRIRLVKDGFPTDRVDLISHQELGHAQLVPADSVAEKLTQHFQQLFQKEEDVRSAQLLTRGGSCTVAP